MHDHFGRLCALVGLATLVMACRDSTGPTVSLTQLGTPDFVARVTSNTHNEFNAPSGYHVSQYEVWVATPPSLFIPNAGVVVAAATPVFVSAAGVLTPGTPAHIAVGDLIQVWHDRTVAYRSMQAPPGAPAYSATQVVIERTP